MGTQGERIFAAIAERGFPDPWATFGEHLSWESAYAVHLKTTIDEARKDPRGQVLAQVRTLFQRKSANLSQATELLNGVLSEYDTSGMWVLLDKRAAQLDIADVSERWAAGPVRHPFAIGLLSLQFNWRYMKQHGVRAFYEMTGRYLAELAASNDTWRAAFETEQASGTLDRITTVECDLASEEAPMHCDICKKTITALLYLEG